MGRIHSSQLWRIVWCGLLAVLTFADSTTTLSSSSSPVVSVLPPRVVDRTETSLSVEWAYPVVNGKPPSSVVFNLVLDGKSVYTGPRTSFVLVGLRPATCYGVAVAGFANGKWGSQSRVTKGSTLASKDSDVPAVAAELHRARVAVLEAAVAAPDLNTCPLTGFALPSYMSGGTSFLEFIGQSGFVSPVGIAAEKLNCDLAQCSTKSRATSPFAQPLVSKLRVSEALHPPHDFRSLTLTLPAASHRLEYADPENPMARVRLPLFGCRAMKQPKTATRQCFVVRCSSRVSQLNVCANSADEADKWVAAVNYASLPSRSVGRYETLLKVSSASAPRAQPRRDKTMAVLEDPGFREAWVVTYLGALARVRATPHFPTFYSHFRCSELPELFTNTPTESDKAVGVLPSTVEAAGLPLSVSSARRDGAIDQMWSVLAMETFQSDLQAVLDSYTDALLSRAFARGVLFQMIHAVGVARHAFGFRHNNLLALRNVKLVQVPVESPGRKKFACYRVSAGAIQGREVAVPSFSSAPAKALPFLYTALGSSAACDHSSTKASQKEAARHSSSSSSSSSGKSGGGPRSSWCIPTADVDGLVVKLHNFEQAALSRKQLEWWSRGYTFPNPPWRDDFHDLAEAACDQFQEKVLGGLGQQGVELCAAMRGGEFADNPLAALNHAFFHDLVSMDAVASQDRQTYQYEPATLPRKPSSSSSSSSSSSTNANSHGDGLSPATIRAILKAITPAPPTYEFLSASQVQVTWTPHPGTHDAPSPRPYSYSLLLNGVSVYSGSAPRYLLALDGHDCAEITVAAYYDKLGWTPPSEASAVIPCE